MNYEGSAERLRRVGSEGTGAALHLDGGHHAVVVQGAGKALDGNICASGDVGEDAAAACRRALALEPLLAYVGDGFLLPV